MYVPAEVGIHELVTESDAPEFRLILVVLVSTLFIKNLMGIPVSFEDPKFVTFVRMLYVLLAKNAGGRLRKGPVRTS